MLLQDGKKFVAIHHIGQAVSREQQAITGMKLIRLLSVTVFRAGTVPTL